MKAQTLSLCSTKGVAFAVFAANADVIIFVNKRGHPKHPTPLRCDYQNTLSRNMKTHLLGPYNIITLPKVLVRLSLDTVSFQIVVPFQTPGTVQNST
jgi:hypothetical protein